MFIKAQLTKLALFFQKGKDDKWLCVKINPLEHEYLSALFIKSCRSYLSKNSTKTLIIPETDQPKVIGKIKSCLISKNQKKVHDLIPPQPLLSFDTIYTDKYKPYLEEIRADRKKTGTARLLVFFSGTWIRFFNSNRNPTDLLSKKIDELKIPKICFPGVAYPEHWYTPAEMINPCHFDPNFANRKEGITSVGKLFPKKWRKKINTSIMDENFRNFDNDFSRCKSTIFGVGYEAHIKMTLNFLKQCRFHNCLPKKLIISGHSRGGCVGAFRLAYEIYQLFGVAIKVHIVSIDPIPGPFRKGKVKERTITPNVRTLILCYAGKQQKDRYWYAKFPGVFKQLKPSELKYQGHPEIKIVHFPDKDHVTIMKDEDACNRIMKMISSIINNSEK